jgi:DNA-binding CsgD family transcriptional regulator
LEAFAKDSESYVKSMKEIRVMPGAEELKKGDLKKKSDKSLAQTVETSYIYQRGQGDDIEKSSKNRRLINAVVADDAALLFAKGVSARQSILVEDGSLYQVEFKKNNIDEILNAQNIVAIATQQRLNRILELRAYMASAGATAELTRQTREADE